MPLCYIQWHFWYVVLVEEMRTKKNVIRGAFVHMWGHFTWVLEKADSKLMRDSPKGGRCVLPSYRI